MRLTNKDGKKIWVNPSHVLTVTSVDGDAKIFTIAHVEIQTDQDYDMVVDYLDSKLNQQTTEDLNV